MYTNRLERLIEVLNTHQLDCLALVPGANFAYMTGLDLHLMERPTVAFLPVGSPPVFVIPSLEKPRFDQKPPFSDLQLFTYTDQEGPLEAFKDAFTALPEMHTLGVEYLAMRVAELELIQRHVPNAMIQDGNPVMDKLRVIKDGDEIARMRRAIEISEQALARVIDAVRPGMTEREVANRLILALMEAGGENVPFAPIVLAGPRAALPHGGPTDARLKAGEVLLVDFGTRSGGYVSDITRTFALGKPLTAMHEAVYEAVLAANAAGVAAAGPGVSCQDVDRAARKVIEEAGFGEFFIHRTGHGIGVDGHERPYIVEGNEQILEPGMTFTVEPGIYIPGEVGVRIEDDVVITEDGAESLTTFPRVITVVGTD